MEYARCIKTGYVYPASVQLRDRADMEVFAATSEPVPAVIPSLIDYLRAADPKPAKALKATAAPATE